MITDQLRCHNCGNEDQTLWEIRPADTALYCGRCGKRYDINRIKNQLKDTMNSNGTIYTVLAIAVLAMIAGAYIRGCYDGANRTRAAFGKPDTVYRTDTIRTPAPPAKILPGKPIPYAVADSTALDSLEQLYLAASDSLTAYRELARRNGTPIEATYEDSLQRSQITAHPATRSVVFKPEYKDRTVQVPLITQPIVTDKPTTILDYWEEITIATLAGFAAGALTK